MKLVINRCYGGFSLSKEAFDFLGIEWADDGYIDIDRSDPKLIECVEILGERVNGKFAELKVVEIPDDVQYEITEYDGIEQVEEVHRIWY